MKSHGTSSDISHASFSYGEAFSRNLGWLTKSEQLLLRHKKIAIPGMGGVGGMYLLALVRLGASKFHISDMDVFEQANFNRQAGAFMSTVGREKVDVMAEMAADINPDVEITLFKEGISEDNIDAFMDGVDLFIDGFDFFALDIRRAVFKRCYELSIPAITCAPVGMGASLLTFLPHRMSFENYFRMSNQDSQEEKYIKFLVGLSARPLPRTYLVDPAYVDMKNKTVPSTTMGIHLCAGLLVTEAFKVLLGRGGVKAAPHYQLYDAYRGVLRKGYIPFGNANPLQRLKYFIGRKFLAKLSETEGQKETVAAEADSVMEKIIDMTRWAPSGDNVQPWRFEIKSVRKLAIHIPEIEKDNPYEFDQGRPTYLAVGMMLECMRMAAAFHGLSMRWKAPGVWDGRAVTIDVNFRKLKKPVKDDLLDYVPLRSVNRFSYQTKNMSDAVKDALSKEVDDLFDILWFESPRQRMSFARLNAMATDIRLRVKACFKVHQKIIDWNKGDSREGVPAGAVGMDKFSLKIMKYAMRSWSRMNFLNKYMGGTILARLQMDILPGYKCAGHFVLLWKEGGKKELADILHAGEKLQRFWLQATKQGLVLQPSMATICFSTYADRGIDFSGGDNALANKASRLGRKFDTLLGGRSGDVVFSGRTGYSGNMPSPVRSLRKDINSLLSGR
ncbi:MAG: thiamine biosynthesis protein ThiF [Alphaproteobacteria bacterium]|nr:MAG: thiamine biosynthesis protein ThiF [Alphaproteobacteria bacterium]